MVKRLLASGPALASVAFLAALYYRLVGGTNRIAYDPPDTFFAPFNEGAAIIALWHGEHFLVPFAGWEKDRMAVLVTTHRDGEIVARSGSQLGMTFIRGSGDHGREFM